MNAEYERDELLVVPDFLPAADCDALHLIDRRAAYSADNWLQRPDFPLRGFS